MKKLLLCALLAGVISPLAAHEIEIEVVGEGMVDANRIFLDEDKCVFHYPVETEWMVEIVMDDESLFSFVPKAPTLPTKALNIDFWNDIFSKTKTFDGNKAKKFPADDGESTYFKINMCAYNGTTWDKVHLTLNLLPTIPRVLSAGFVTPYDWEYDDFGYDVVGNFAAYLTTARTSTVTEWHSSPIEDWSKGTMYWINDTDYPTNNVGGKNITVTPSGPSTSDCPGTVTTWGEYILYVNYNKYGWVRGDTIYTTDYITDPDVLERIRQICDEYGYLYNYAPFSGVEPIKRDREKGELSLKNGMVVYSGNNEDITAVSLHDVYGRQIYLKNGDSSIDTRDLSTGIYFAVFTLKNNTNISFKFLKR